MRHVPTLPAADAKQARGIEHMENEKTPIIGILKFKAWEDQDKIRLKGLCVTKMLRSSKPIDTDKITIDVSLMENAAEIHFRERFGKWLPRGFRLNAFELAIDRRNAETFDIQNKLRVNYDGKYTGRFLYSLYDHRRGHNHNSDVFVRDGIAMYFRQTIFNSLTLTVRDANIYDLPEGQERIRQAYRKAQEARKLRRSGKDLSPEPIFMYEKNCSRYEESASVLYEKLIDAGYDNVYYIVNEDNPAIADLPEKYRRNLVWKDSDRHIELFFECDRFISTETLDHALQLRVASKLVLDKLASKDLMYVFLQHGVMYMISLNSDQRTGFRHKDCRLHRTVVSSEAEAQHFIDLGGMPREALYITGLAKFDKCYREPDADKIIIMPTWRRWESNQVKHDIEASGYYKMIERMFDAVPPHLRDKAVILPHPLMVKSFRDSGSMVDHLLFADSYDKVLRQCDLLITDYSSIAYDAFYRGANVIFCWEEKDECMTHYGEDTHLMLNESNAFGDITMNGDELAAAIERRYGQSQPEEYIEAYSHIVEFRDGRNSERIMECLRRDKVIG